MESPQSGATETLAYATPDHRRGQSAGGTVGVILVALFICIAAVAIFALVIHEHQEANAAALAVSALAAMGTCCAFFLTRR